MADAVQYPHHNVQDFEFAFSRKHGSRYRAFRRRRKRRGYAAGNLKASSKLDKSPIDIRVDSMFSIMTDLRNSHLRTGDEYRTDRERLEAELAQAQFLIEQMRRSTSWKISARAIGKIFR
jgi:hypothetical protein